MLSRYHDSELAATNVTGLLDDFQKSEKIIFRKKSWKFSKIHAFFFESSKSECLSVKNFVYRCYWRNKPPRAFWSKLWVIRWPILALRGRIFNDFLSEFPDLAGPSNIVTFVAAAPETWFSKRADAQLHLGTFYIARGQTLVKLDKFKQHKQDVDFDLKSARRQLWTEHFGIVTLGSSSCLCYLNLSSFTSFCHLAM